MVDVTKVELKAVKARGRRILVTEPRASFAHYDRATGRVVIVLTNGRTYAFPTRLVQDLRGASEVSLEAVQVDGLGLDLHGVIVESVSKRTEPRPQPFLSEKSPWNEGVWNDGIKPFAWHRSGKGRSIESRSLRRAVRQSYPLVRYGGRDLLKPENELRRI
jgi:hypothetical protein